MAVKICRPCITLRSGRKLCAQEVGRKAFCFEVDEEKKLTKNTKVPTKFRDQDETFVEKENS